MIHPRALFASGQRAKEWIVRGQGRWNPLDERACSPAAGQARSGPSKSCRSADTFPRELAA